MKNNISTFLSKQTTLDSALKKKERPIEAETSTPTGNHKLLNIFNYEEHIQKKIKKIETFSLTQLSEVINARSKF